MLKDIPPNRCRSGRDTLTMEQNLSESNEKLPIISIGITIAPIRLSEILKQVIRRLEVFFIDCFVLRKETIRKTLIVTITGQ